MKNKTPREFIIALNYAHKYGLFNPRKDTKKAEKEFGSWADQHLGIIDTCTEYGKVKDEANVKSSTIL